MNWIRDVSQSTSPYNLSIDGDDDEMLFAYSLEKKDELGFNSVNGLPVIQEGRKA